ncbi:MAG: hypothetical protein HW421_3745 [Ignavibacteria bacterium]|nr:hypothetical protein [Ignavibacteria bacterium]
MKKIILTLIIIALLPTASNAGIYGILKGRVVDNEGKGLLSASILVVGTTRGMRVKEKDGSFILANINAGTYDIKITMTGFREKIITGVVIPQDNTRDLGDIKLEISAKMLKALIVEDKKIMVRNNDIGKQTVIDKDMATKTAREGLNSVIGTTAGVSTGNAGFNIRGHREEETQFRVNGFDIGNQAGGGFGLMGVNYAPMTSSYALEEVQVTTGNFSAEYGEAMGGIVNATTKKGSTEKYEAFIRWRTDLSSLYGSHANGLKLVPDGSGYKIVETDNGPKLLGTGDHFFDAGMGGPIPMLENCTFFISTRYNYQKYFSGNLDVKEPSGQSLGQIPNNRLDIKNLSPYFNFQISEKVRLELGFSYGLTSRQQGGWNWLYATDPGIINGVSNGIPESRAKQFVVNQLNTNYYARINHAISSTQFYEISISNASQNDEYSKPADFEGPSYFTGYNTIKPVDELESLVGPLVPGKDRTIDYWQSGSELKKSADGYFPKNILTINPLTGYIEGQRDRTGTNNPYGIYNYFETHGNTTLMQFRKSNYWQLSGFYNDIFDMGGFNHNLKTGIEARLFNIKRFYQQDPNDASSFWDVYTDDWGGNILVPDTTKVYKLTSQPKKPFRIAAYLQDQITYKGIIFSPGIRLDYFDAQSNYRSNKETFIPITSDTGLAAVKPKFSISPRMSIAYPLTPTSGISIEYGIYYKNPDLEDLYDGYTIYLLRGNSIVGEPNMKQQRTNAYGIAYNNQLTDDFMLSVAAYYQDIYNQTGTVYVAASPQPYYMLTTNEFGNSKGLEFTLRKLPSTDHFGFSLNYTISSAMTTAPGVTSNYNPQTDPFTGKPAFPQFVFATDWDRPHKVNLSVDFRWNNDEGPEVFGIQPLENLNANFSGYFHTGTPYTKTDAAGKALSERNAERQPSAWQLDLRLTKLFMVKDWIGESAGKTSIEFFFDVLNILNNHQYTAVYAATGTPYDDGTVLRRETGDFGSENLYEKATILNVRSTLSSQYDSFGNRLYSANADNDHNGIVTQGEKLTAYYKYVGNIIERKANYLAPLRVYFGIMFRF